MEAVEQLVKEVEVEGGAIPRASQDLSRASVSSRQCQVGAACNWTLQSSSRGFRKPGTSHEQQQHVHACKCCCPHHGRIWPAGDAAGVLGRVHQLQHRAHRVCFVC
jgi:hypothetical protein